jgi:hypothetical protein
LAHLLVSERLRRTAAAGHAGGQTPALGLHLGAGEPGDWRRGVGTAAGAAGPNCRRAGRSTKGAKADPRACPPLNTCLSPVGLRRLPRLWQGSGLGACSAQLGLAWAGRRGTGKNMRVFENTHVSQRDSKYQWQIVAANMTRVGAAVLFCSLALVCAWGPPSDYGGVFKPGWNGLARTPPMGWRCECSIGSCLI